MKIALLAPPYLPVPPLAYGGTEKIVSLLADGLVDAGFDVTLFASGDSQTRAKLVSIFPKSIGNSGLLKRDAILPLLHYHACFKRADEFDLIHNHAQYLPMFLADLIKIPVVHTMHGSFYENEVLESKRRVLLQFKHHRFVSISDNQRNGLPSLNFMGTVYNGIDTSEYTYVEKPRGDYLLWVGRITEKKGPITAIEVAKKLNIPLVIAAAVDPVDKPYFEKEVKPHLDKKLITFVGELTAETLNHLYGNAIATLFPITWHEPFGLVMIESMVCGTPVVAYNMGSVAEVIENGKTGFVTDVSAGVEGLTHAVNEVKNLQRGDCRTSVVARFSKEAMVKGYIEVYKKILSPK